MFEFTIQNRELLTSFMSMFSDYVNKSYKFTMHYIGNPLFSDFRDNERLVLIAVNKSVYQNIYSYLRLNERNMQYAAFACLENAINAMRLYRVLYGSTKNMHDYISTVNFSMEEAERELDEQYSKKTEEQTDDDVKEQEDFSLKAFSDSLRQFCTFRLKSPSISSQLVNQNIYLGLGCGKDQVSDELQHEVRKNLAGAYTSLSKHTKLFFNGGMDDDLEELEADLYAKFMEYVKTYLS